MEKKREREKRDATDSRRKVKCRIAENAMNRCS